SPTRPRHLAGGDAVEFGGSYAGPDHRLASGIAPCSIAARLVDAHLAEPAPVQVLANEPLHSLGCDAGRQPEADLRQCLLGKDAAIGGAGISAGEAHHATTHIGVEIVDVVGHRPSGAKFLDAQDGPPLLFRFGGESGAEDFQLFAVGWMQGSQLFLEAIDADLVALVENRP